MKLLILMIALTLAPSVRVSQAFALGGEDFDKLRKAALSGDAPGKPLHSNVVAVFGLAEKMPILVREIVWRGVGPERERQESSIWFSSTTDDAFFVEQTNDAVRVYHTDRSCVLLAAAVGKGLNDLRLIQNEEASNSFEATLRLWERNAQGLTAR